MTYLILFLKKNEHAVCAENSLSLDTHLALNAPHYAIKAVALESYEKPEKLKLYLVSTHPKKINK